MWRDEIQAIVFFVTFVMLWMSAGFAYGVLGFALGWLPSIVLALMATSMAEYLIAIVAIVALITVKFWT